MMFSQNCLLYSWHSIFLASFNEYADVYDEVEEYLYEERGSGHGDENCSYGSVTCEGDSPATKKEYAHSGELSTLHEWVNILTFTFSTLIAILQFRNKRPVGFSSSYIHIHTPGLVNIFKTFLLYWLFGLFNLFQTC